MDPNGTARPEQIVALLGLEPDGVQIARERIDLND
jgi:hypothetical protein